MRAWATLATLVVAGLAALAPAACGDGDGRSGQPLDVVATTSWLADIAQNVAGDRLTIEAMVPLGADPHAFEPTPSDLTRIATSDLLVVNGGGLDAALQSTLDEAGGDVTTVVASEGLTPRTPGPREPAADESSDPASGDVDSGSGVDAHFWLDPISVVTYVENIRDALIDADPEGTATYRANADAYVDRLRTLDDEIRAEVESIPAADRELVTNHASHGYFADRYGFEVVGAVIPSMGTDATPTARQLADLVATIRETGARAIFVEADENPQLAEQIADETGVTVETGLLDHSLTGPDGAAPTYLEMMRYDTSLIVEALRSP